MDTNFMLYGLAIAAAVFITFWALSPVVLRMDRISFVMASMNPQMQGMLALKMYWHLYKNEDALKEMEEKQKLDQEIKFESAI
jgi:hypothetical protein